MDSQGKNLSLNFPCSLHNVIRVNSKSSEDLGGGGEDWAEGKCDTEFLILAFKNLSDTCSPHPHTLCSSYSNTTSTCLNKLICVDAADTIPCAEYKSVSHSLRNTDSSFKAQLKYQLLYEVLPYHHV